VVEKEVARRTGVCFDFCSVLTLFLLSGTKDQLELPDPGLAAQEVSSSSACFAIRVCHRSAPAAINRFKLPLEGAASLL
jgi:hypothetical protein